MLIQTASNTLHIMDTRILKVLTNIDPLPKPLLKRNAASPFLPPLPNPTPSLFKRSRFSPCGNFILSGLSVYKTDSGKKVGKYEGSAMVVDVAWHPQDYTACLVQYASCRVQVYTHDPALKPVEEPVSESVTGSPMKIDMAYADSPVSPSNPNAKETLSYAFREAMENLKLGKDLSGK